MKNIELFTDGACSGNPGPGGWGSILKFGDKEKVMSGGDPATTNNRMELTAVIEGLAILNQPCNVTVYTDSKYVSDSITKGWAKSWQAKGWRKSDNKPALNSDLWERLLELSQIHTLKMVWIKGHAGHKENERCDALAVAESQKFK